MALRIRFQYPTGALLGYSIERLSDGSLFDFTDSRFRASPASPIAILPEDSGNFVGRYKLTLAPIDTVQFLNGDYVITIHDRNASNLVLAQLPCVLFNGDDATVFPTASATTAPIDPWSVVLPGNYASGTAGSILATNLDAKVSSRSIYAGGPVASVSGPVTVAQNNDKSGYSLAPSGLDSITVESGINARQALSPMLAAVAGVLAGAGTGSVSIKAAGGTTTRITATTDNAGNRSAINLNLPA